MNRNSKVETTLAGRKTDKPQLPPPGLPRFTPSQPTLCRWKI